MASCDSFSTDDAVRGYLPLMHELATRLDLVAHACEGRLNLTPPYAREYAYLQFRRMCELIALGCLQLHGDLPQTQTQSIKKEWNAEKIMGLLHRSYPHAFPQAIKREVTPNGWHIQANANPNALTLEGFKALYSQCGEVLHRGTIRSLQSATPLEEYDYQKVMSWQSKVVDLMNEHLIGRAHGAGFYIVSLRTASGFPECSVFSPTSAGMDVAIRTMNIL
ncbi:MAG TPA: hypothetical protein VMS31_03285 [Pyrinomonadaceae bacterium]|nr:hypothetical protein [Pyrinomonadaceae bacterium]